MPISQLDLETMQRRLAANRKKSPPMDDVDAVRAEYEEPRENTPESKIHAQIKEHCRLKGWFCDGSIIGVTNTRRIAKGGTDLIVRTYLADYWIEVKRPKDSKLTVDQQGTLAWLKKLGAKAFVVRSIEEFIALVK